MFYIDENDYPESYSKEILKYQTKILEVVKAFNGERIDMFEKSISIVFGQRIRIEYDWVGHRGKLFLVTREDAFAQNIYNEDMYWDSYEEDYDYDRY